MGMVVSRAQAPLGLDRVRGSQPGPSLSASRVCQCRGARPSNSRSRKTSAHGSSRRVA